MERGGGEGSADGGVVADEPASVLEDLRGLRQQEGGHEKEQR